MAPEQNTPPSSSGDTTEYNANDIYKALSEESDEQKEEKLELPEDTEEDKEEDKEKDKEDEGEEEKEPEEEIKLKEDEEKEEELDEFVTPFRRKEILKKYPNIFKEFPYLEKAYYREQKFSEVFPSIDDAKHASERAKTLDTFESKLLSGDASEVLAAVRDTDKHAFAKIVDDYLPQLMRVDQSAFYHVISNVFKDAIVTMVNEGRRNEDDELIKTAEKLNEFIFRTKEFVPKSKLADEKQNEEQNKLSAEREAFIREQYETHKGDLDGRISNTLKVTLLDYIDPKDVMTPYVKTKAVEDALAEVNTQIRSDSRFMATFDKLWENSFNNKFSKDSLDKIRSAYLSKAKTLLPGIIQKTRKNALMGLGKNQQREEKDRRGPLPVGRSTSSSNRGKPEAPKPGEKTLAYLMRD